MLPTTLVVMEEQSSSLAEQITQKLIPNLGSFLTQLFALLVMILIIFIFGYKPISKMLKKRNDHIESNIKEAEEQNKEAALNLSQSQEKIMESQKQAAQIISEAKLQAGEEKKKILEETNLEVSKMKETAQKEIKQAEEEERENIRKEMISVALDASSELLKRNITSADNEKLVDSFIKEMDS